MLKLKRRSGSKGFTLIELVVVIAILGVLAAIAVPAVISFVSRGGDSALEADEKLIQSAVDEFKADKHKGPNSSNVWGSQSTATRLYPTRDGLVGSIELSTTTTDTNFTDRSNYMVMHYAAGPATGLAVTTSQQVANASVWFGLLVNEASNSTGSEQDDPGNSHPQSGEKAVYLLEMPRSAIASTTNSLTSGSYYWVILQNGKVAPAYLGNNTTSFFVGSNDAYP